MAKFDPCTLKVDQFLTYWKTFVMHADYYCRDIHANINGNNYTRIPDVNNSTPRKITQKDELLAVKSLEKGSEIMCHQKMVKNIIKSMTQHNQQNHK